MDAAYLVDVAYMVHVNDNEIDFESVDNSEQVYPSLIEAKKAALQYDLHQHKQDLLNRLNGDRGRIQAEVVTIKEGDITDTLMMKYLECTLEKGKPAWEENISAVEGQPPQ